MQELAVRTIHLILFIMDCLCCPQIHIDFYHAMRYWKVGHLGGVLYNESITLMNRVRVLIGDIGELAFVVFHVITQWEDSALQIKK